MMESPAQSSSLLSPPAIERKQLKPVVADYHVDSAQLDRIESKLSEVLVGVNEVLVGLLGLGLGLALVLVVELFELRV